MSTPLLFDDLPAVTGVQDEGKTKARGRARVLLPNRAQLELRPSDLESLLAEGHRARLVWGFVERQDLSALYAKIKVVEGGVGRSAIAPEILYALWLYATLEGVGSARKLWRLTQEHDAYRWICGGVQVNYHALADFRSAGEEALDGLLSENVAGLMAAGVVKLQSVAQDGMRVRANAGAASFRREEKLTDYLAAARERVAALKQAVEDDPGAETRRRKAARERAAKEREARIEAALARLPELTAIKKRQGKGARLDHRCRSDRHEDGRRRLSAGVQPPVWQRYRKPDHRGRGRGEHGQRHGANGADGRPGDRAVRRGAAELVGQWRLPGARPDRRRRRAHAGDRSGPQAEGSQGQAGRQGRWRRRGSDRRPSRRAPGGPRGSASTQARRQRGGR